MRRYLKGICLFVCASVLFFGVCFAQDIAQDFSLTDTQSRVVTLSSFKGKKSVLLFFWTTWCPYCVQQLKSLNTTYAKMSAEGIQVLPINVGESSEKVVKFLARNKVSFASLLDENGKIADMYALIGVPTYGLVDNQGNLVFFGNNFPQEEYKALLRKEAKPVTSI